MGHRGKTYSPPFKDSRSSSPIIKHYFHNHDNNNENSILDEEILLMTDAEKESFAKMQSQLEEQCLSKFYHHYYKNDFEDVKKSKSLKFRNIKEENNNSSNNNNKIVHRRSNSFIDFRLENSQKIVSSRPNSIRRSRTNSIETSNLFIYPSSQRFRERQVQYENHLEDELTFHPQINQSNVQPRYLNYTMRRTNKSTLSDIDDYEIEDVSTFKPIINRLRCSSASDKLNRYLRVPVHQRLGRVNSLLSRDKKKKKKQHQEEEEEEKEEEDQTKKMNKEKKENEISKAFLQRLEESNRRKERNLQRIATIYENELTFHPKLAPGTQKRRATSVVASHISKENKKSSSLNSHLGIESLDNEVVVEVKNNINSLQEQERPYPKINSRSQNMKRSMNDLQLFEQRRQQRLQQLRKEIEKEELNSLSYTPAVSIGSQKIAESLFGREINHNIIQEHLEQQARIRTAIIKMKNEIKKREEEKEFTFQPEVHSAPPYIHELALELAVNKSIVPKERKLKPSFRFS